MKTTNSSKRLTILREATVKVPRAIGLGLVIYFGLVVPGQQASLDHRPKTQDTKPHSPSVPVPAIYRPALKE